MCLGIQNKIKKWINPSQHRTCSFIQQCLYLHCNRKVILGFWRKENIHSFLWKRLIPSRWCPHFNNMQLEANGQKQTKSGFKGHCNVFLKDVHLNFAFSQCLFWFLFWNDYARLFISYFSSCLSSYSKAEQSWFFSVALHLKLCKTSGVSFNGLGHLPVYRV